MPRQRIILLEDRVVANKRDSRFRGVIGRVVEISYRPGKENVYTVEYDTLDGLAYGKFTQFTLKKA